MNDFRSATAPLTLVPNKSCQQLALAERFDTGQRAMAAPPVEVFSLWAASLLERALLIRGEASPVRPSRLQLRRLWQEAIRVTDRQGLLPADVTALAQEAMEADRLCEHWLLPAGLTPGRSWRDEGFCLWRERVHAALQARGWLDAAGQLGRLAELLEAPDPLRTLLPAGIRLQGFVEITPLEERVLKALAGRGVERLDEAPADVQPRLLEAELLPTRDEELWAAAQWAQQLHAQGEVSIAVAVQDFKALRPSLQRVFQQTFHPRESLAGTEPELPAFHVDGGEPLARHPLIEAAFDLLELSQGGLQRARSFALLSRWLLSPAWAGADTERAARARLELALRAAGRYEPSLAFVADLARKFDCPVLLERTTRLPDGASGRQPGPPSAALAVRDILNHWGWPGPMAAGPRARQAVDGLQQALEELEFSSQAVAGDALSDLRQLCRERTMHNAGGVLSAVQVLPLEDAVDQAFEHLRIVNVHGDNWPAPVRLNRLLPYRLREHLPRSDMQGQLAHARDIQLGVMRRAGRVVFSRAEQLDGVTSAVSPLVQALGLRERPAAADPSGLARAVWPDAGLEKVLNTRDQLFSVPREAGPALAPGARSLHGVVGLLRLQAACPWAAFLVHRLDARMPDPPTPFANAMVTGALVHAALEHLYTPHLGTASRPAAAEVPGAVRDALSASHAPQRLAPGALKAEQRRLESLLQEWLETEQSLQLGDPCYLEESRDASLAGFEFTVRLDRLDTLAGGVLVLDYKTGTLPKMSWGDARPTELQLPLYAVLARHAEEPVQGIGLLSLRSGEMKQAIWSGSDEVQGAGVQRVGQSKSVPFANWEAALDGWETAISSLLEEFRAGRADFEVYHPQALAWSGLELLLRLQSEASVTALEVSDEA